MKIHTNDFKTNISSIGKQLDSIITYSLDGVTTELKTEDLNSVTPTFQGAILKSVMKELDLDSNVDIPIGTEINYKFGVKLDGDFEYIDYGNYIVYKSEKQEDTSSYKITCYDKLLYSMKTNEALGITYPLSVRDYINALCTKIGLEFKNKNDEFANFDRILDKELYAGLDYTYRDIFDELAQVTASTICLDNEDKVEIRYIANTAIDTIDENFLKDVNVNFGEKYGPVNSIVLSRSNSDNIYLKDEDSVAKNGLCEIKINDNQIMNWDDRSDYLPDILEKLDGLEYYLNDFSSTGIAYLDLCDRYNINVFNNTYSCIMFNDELDVTQGLEEVIHTDMPEETETDYTKADKTDRKINNVSLIVDKQQQEITALAEKVQDVSRTVTGTRSITLEDCNKTPLYKLVITGDDSKLFPNSKLFPSQTTFIKNSHLVVNKDTQNEKFYDLKIPALRTLGDVKDEYIMEDYNATYIKRVGINDNLEKYVLDKPIETDLGQIIVELEEGTNTLTMSSFPTNTYTATYLVKNQYTDTFASTAYVDSQIKISTDNILLESKSYTDKSTEGDELISKINLDSTGAVKIEASKTLDLTGSVINMTADDVRIKSNRLDIEPDGTINLIDDGARNPNNPSASYIINSSWLETVSETEYNKLDATHKITSVSRDFHYEAKNTISSSTGYGNYDGKILETLYKYPSTIWEYGNAEVGYENTSVSYSGITTPQLTQTSLAEKKKNFSKYEGALEEIKKIDIYKYNLKFESDDTKKHLGFVIGEGYNYSEVITDNKNEGVDNYSMTSLCLQAIKEQQKIIEDLQKKINSIIMDKESDK